MSGGLTPCRQLRPSSRREHVKASKSYMEWKMQAPNFIQKKSNVSRNFVYGLSMSSSSNLNIHLLWLFFSFKHEYEHSIFEEVFQWQEF